MKCEFADTDETHRTGRTVGKCVRCGQTGLRPEGGWERLYSECRGLPRFHELGGWLELILEAAFITKPRWLWIKGMVGAKQSCGCQERQTALNRLGLLIKASLERYGRLLGAAWGRWLSIWPK